MPSPRPEPPGRYLKNLPPVGLAGPHIDMPQTGYLTRPILFLHTMPRPATLNGQGSPVTTTRSIFQKTCPACMVTLALDASDCACGHQFDHDNNDASLSSEAIRLQAEELYENYLAARAEQASGAVMAAQAEFASDPTSAQKSQRVANLIQEAEAARAALTAQSARVAEMRKALPPAPAPVPRPIHAAEAPKKKVVEMKKVPPAPAPRPAHTAAATKKKVTAKPVVTPSPARTATRVASSSNDTDNAITTSLLTRHAARKAASASAKARPAPAPVAARPKPSLPPPVQTRTPNPAFRQVQAARAEKILRQAETTAAVKAVIKEESAVAPKMAAAPKRESKTPPPAAPALTKSAPRLLGGDKKECPNCTASVDSKINRCRCGFEFPTSETLMPALSMSEEERAEFAKLFSFP
jgi:hypothetical protein